MPWRSAWMRKLLLALMLPALAGCYAAPPRVAGPAFHPQDWFRGHMHSDGVLRVILAKPRGLKVESTGTAQPDGSVRLDQAIHWAGGAVDHRTWIMKPRPGGGYAVSLTEAAGPVAFDTEGPRAHLRYRDKRGALPLTIEQWMDLTPDGRALDNNGVVSVLGIPIARLSELIVHDPG